jgi:hypothetical protein
MKIFCGVVGLLLQQYNWVYVGEWRVYVILLNEGAKAWYGL